MEKGNIKWDKAVIGDSARVKSENKMGLIIKDYGRKFHLKFSDGKEKTYDASELDFYRFDEYGEGGGVHSKIYSAKKEKGRNYIYKNGVKYGYLHTIYQRRGNREVPTIVLVRLSDGKYFKSLYTFQKDVYAWVNSTGEMFESLHEEEMEQGGNIEKENNDMLQGQIKEATHHAKELGYIVNDKTVIEPWVVAKMERATTDLSDVTHYLDGQEDKRMKKPIYATGGNLDNVFSSKADDFLYSNIAQKWEHLQEIRSDIKTFLTLSNDLSGEELTFDVANALVLGIIDAVRIIKENGGDELADDISEMFNRAKSEIKE
jgi:hypothetical protein